MKQLKFRRLLGPLVALLCLAATGTLGWYYFNFPAIGTGSFYRTIEEFYKPIDADWLSPNVDQIMAEISTGDPDKFNLLVARTVLTRWRIRHEAPNALKSLMSEFDRGLWRGHRSDDWLRAMEEIDRKWFDARDIAKRLWIDTVPPRQEGRSNDGFSFKFDDTLVTSQIGSEVIIEVLMPRGIQVSGTPEIFWQTDVTNKVLNMLRRTPQWEDEVTTSGRTLITLHVDMSADPLWLMPETRPTYFFLTFPNIGRGDILSIRCGDSPRLQPPPASPK